MAHRRAKLTPSGRRLLVDRVLVYGWPACRAAEAAGVSRATAYKWVGRFRSEGQSGLEDRSSKPRCMPKQLASDVVAQVLAVRRDRRWGPHRLAAVLKLPRSTVYAVLRRHGCSRLADFDRATGKALRYVRANAGELVHVDIKKLGRIPDGGGHRIFGEASRPTVNPRLGYDFIHVAVDDASRLAFVQVFPDEGPRAASQFLRAAVAFYAKHGIRVERVLTDRGNAYMSGGFRLAAQGLGIRHKLTRPRRPQTNGKAERLIQTLLREWAYSRLFTSNAARLAALPRWVYFYNSRRPHTALSGCSPLAAVNNLRGNYI
jgi:transposase InsO family protein